MSSGEIRDRLFEAALPLFRSQGYEETSVAQLTGATGVAKGTFFNHFPTKEHVLAEFLGRVWEDATAEAEGDGHRGTDAVIHVLDALMRRLEANPVLTRALALRLPHLPTPPALAPGSDDEPGALVDFWAVWMRARIDESLPIAVPLQEVDAKDLASLIVGALSQTLREGSMPSAAEEPLAPAMGARAVFLLRSAGFVAPDPPRSAPAH